MSTKSRIKLLEKIAQAAEQQESGTNTVSGSPTTADVVALFPQSSIAWGANNIKHLQDIINVLNQSIYILSQGQVDFNRLRTQSFNVDESKFPDTILKAIISLARTIYNKLLTNNGQIFKKELTPEEKQEIIDLLKQNISISSIPDGGINKFLTTKIGGNFKTVIINLLSNIK